MADEVKHVGDIIFLNPHSRMSVTDALATSSRFNLNEVLVTGYDQDGCFVSISSSMKRKDVLWLLEQAKVILMEDV